MKRGNNRYLSYSDTKNCHQGLVELLVTLEHCAPTLFFTLLLSSPPFFLSSIDFPAINRRIGNSRLPRQGLVRYCKKKKSARIKDETSIIEHPILKKSFVLPCLFCPSPRDRNNHFVTQSTCVCNFISRVKNSERNIKNYVSASRRVKSE